MHVGELATFFIRIIAFVISPTVFFLLLIRLRILRLLVTNDHPEKMTQEWITDNVLKML